MKCPGLPIAFANSAACELTGYSKEHMEWKNCRFLQGKKTEGAAVRMMTTSLRKVSVAVTRAPPLSRRCHVPAPSRCRFSLALSPPPTATLPARTGMFFALYLPACPPGHALHRPHHQL